MIGCDEEVIDKPVPPGVIKNILYSRCTSYDVTIFVSTSRDVAALCHDVIAKFLVVSVITTSY